MYCSILGFTEKDKTIKLSSQPLFLSPSLVSLYYSKFPVASKLSVKADNGTSCFQTFIEPSCKRNGKIDASMGAAV